MSTLKLCLGQCWGLRPHRPQNRVVQFGNILFLVRIPSIQDDSVNAAHDKTQENVIRILNTYKKVAMVGLSANPERPSYGVAEYLISRGYEVIPVNPRYDKILGKQSYPSLHDVPKPLEIVDVFRKSEDVLPVAEDALKEGAKVFWMQLNIRNDEAADLLEKHGITVIQDRCIAQELRHHLPG